ncbi:MAG TPA: YkvA family protein [Solirubrobacteraceae bacterium]|nr:YkvA family protein [Solirubrobacteraceae bacterium]
MSTLQWLLILALAAVLVYAIFVGVLVLAGRRADARAVAGFVPDCIVLFRRLLGDPRMPRRYRAIVVALLGYLALPFDIVPDFIPVAGQLDDAIVVALVLRAILRGAGLDMVEEHWPGPPASLALILKLAHSSAKP